MRPLCFKFHFALCLLGLPALVAAESNAGTETLTPLDGRTSMESFTMDSFIAKGAAAREAEEKRAAAAKEAAPAARHLEDSAPGRRIEVLTREGGLRRVNPILTAPERTGLLEPILAIPVLTPPQREPSAERPAPPPALESPAPPPVAGKAPAKTAPPLMNDIPVSPPEEPVAQARSLPQPIAPVIPDIQQPTAPAGPDVSIILSGVRFYPAHVRLRSGQRTRLIFTTVNPRPAALVIERVNVQRWIVNEDRTDVRRNLASSFESNRELSRQGVTEIILDPIAGNYTFHDPVSGAQGLISVDE